MRICVLGGAQTDFERNWTKEGKGFVALLREVVGDGLAASGLTYSDIAHLRSENRIACFLGNFLGEKFISQGHLGAFLSLVDESFIGIPSAKYEAACASGSIALEAAISRIKAGDIDVAIVVGAELMKTVDSVVCGDYLGYAAFFEKECSPGGYPFPTLFGKLADEILRKNLSLGETRFMDALASISYINYSNAKRNPNAQTRKWFMSLEHAKHRGGETNRLVGGRLAVSDCSQVTDGAAMVVLCSEDFFITRGIQRKVVLQGYGHRNAPLLFRDKIAEGKLGPYLLPWVKQTIDDTYQMARMTVKDIDCFEVHDCFTSSEYLAISSLGITRPGEEYLAIENGTIAFCGSKPINPSGGLIGCGHPVGATGVRMFLDCYKQVSGTAGSYQVNGAKNAMMLNIGGTATTVLSFILGREN